jgi:hypothetical protein
MKKPILCFLALLVSAPVSAGQLVEAYMSGAALQFLTEGRVTSCGLRFAALENISATSDRSLHEVGGSVLIYANGHAAVKGVLTSVTTAQVLSQQIGTSSNIPIQTMWFRAPGSKPTKSILDVPTDTVNAVFYGSEFMPALAVLEAAISGKPIQIGFLQQDGNSEVILYGDVVISKGDIAQLGQCIGEMVDVLRGNTNKAPKGKKPSAGGK